MIRLAVLLLLLTTPAWAQTPAQADQRLRTVTYDASQVIRLQIPANFHTAVIFGPNEQVENVAIGDSEGWQATLNEAADALFIKPVRQGGVTNMTVITNARVYSFELSSAYGATADAPFTVRFRYPDEPPQTASDLSQPRLGRYRISGSRGVRPIAVVDDGVRTSIEWGSTQVIPAIFAIDDRGQETLVEGQMRDGLFVIDAVHAGLVFRVDRQTARAVRLRDGSRR